MKSLAPDHLTQSMREHKFTIYERKLKKKEHRGEMNKY